MSVPVYFLTQSMDFIFRVLIWVPLVYILLVSILLLLIFYRLIIALSKNPKIKNTLKKGSEKLSEEIQNRKTIFTEKEIIYSKETTLLYSEITEVFYSNNFLNILKENEKMITAFNIKLGGMKENDKKEIIQFITKKGTDHGGFQITKI